MSKPAKLKFTIYQGATFRKRLTWKAYPYAVNFIDGVAYRASDGSVAPTSDQVPVNLTGCTGRMHIRAKLADPIPLLTLTTENSRMTLGGTAGTTDLFITDEDTTLITWTSGVWDLEIAHPSGDVTRLAEGSISVSKEVTRA
jgi:hypothetical protein